MQCLAVQHITQCKPLNTHRLFTLGARLGRRIFSFKTILYDHGPSFALHGLVKSKPPRETCPSIRPLIHPFSRFIMAAPLAPSGVNLADDQRENIIVGVSIVSALSGLALVARLVSMKINKIGITFSAVFVILGLFFHGWTRLW